MLPLPKKLSTTGCPGGANGKLCHSLGTERAKMSVYMESIKLQDSYIPLKTRYLEQQARAFPSLGKKGDNSNQQGENMDRDDSHDDNEEANEQVLPISPVEERDAKIINLQKELVKLQEEVKDVNNLKENLTKAQAENTLVKKTSFQLTKKLNLTRKTNEIKLAEMITQGSLDVEHSPHLITSFTATLCEDDFELNLENDLITPKNEFFLKNIEDRCNLDDHGQKERYGRVRDQVLDRVKRLLTSSPIRGGRRNSISSNPGVKRDWWESDDEKADILPSNKPRMVSPLKSE